MDIPHNIFAKYKYCVKIEINMLIHIIKNKLF